MRQKQRFSLRKSKLGTASVLLGLTLLGGLSLNSSNVYAAEDGNKSMHEIFVKTENSNVTVEKVDEARKNLEKVKKDFDNQKRVVDFENNSIAELNKAVRNKKLDLESATKIKKEATPQNIKSVENRINSLESSKKTLEKNIEISKLSALNIEKEIKKQEKTIDLVKEDTKIKQSLVDSAKAKIEEAKSEAVYDKLNKEKKAADKLTSDILNTKKNIKSISEEIDKGVNEKNSLVEKGNETRKKLEDEVKKSGPEYLIENVERELRRDEVSKGDAISTPLSPENSSWVNKSGEKLYRVANENVDFNGEKTETIVVNSKDDVNKPHVIDYKKVSEYIREYLVELRRINGIDIPVPEVTEKALKWAKARTNEMAKNNKLSHGTVLKASEFSLNYETENASQGALPEKSILDEKQIAYTELLQYFNDYSNVNGYGAVDPNEANIFNYGHRVPLLAASGTGFAVSATNEFGILTFVSDNDKRIYGTLPSEISPTERRSYEYDGKTYYYNPSDSYSLSRAENKDGDKERSEFYYNGKRVKFLPKTTFRYVWNETVRHRNLKRDEALNKLDEFNRKQLELEENQTKKINKLNGDLIKNKNDLFKAEKDLTYTTQVVRKLIIENDKKNQEIRTLNRDLDEKLVVLKLAQDKKSKEEVKLSILKSKLSKENSKLELERKTLNSEDLKLLEAKKYRASLVSASENIKKIEAELNRLTKELTDRKKLLLSESAKLEKKRKELELANSRYEYLRKELDRLRNATSSGWIKEGNSWRYRNADGTYVKNMWKGNYWLGSDGRMVTNSWVDNNRYYVGNDGAWIKDYSRTGWVQESGVWYYYKNGNRVRNAWEGNYWLGADGRMATNSWVDNNRYYVGNDGAWIKDYRKTGWVKESGVWYYYKNGNRVKNAWEGNYWLGADGRMATNSWVDNNRYYVGNDGVWIKDYRRTGWIQESGVWYYYKNGNRVRNAWEGNYWLGADGRMATNSWVDNNRYYVGNDGAWIKDYRKTGWVKESGVWYYYKNGNRVRNAWEGNYWLGADGRMATNSWVDNNRYYVGNDGAWIPRR